MCNSITHGRYYRWVDLDYAMHVKYSFESSSSQMFLFATQHFAFVSWGQITSRFFFCFVNMLVQCYILLIIVCALTCTKQN